MQQPLLTCRGCGDFRTAALTQLLLRPSAEMRARVKAFEEEHFGGGCYVAIHLRSMDNECHQRTTGLLGCQTVTAQDMGRPVTQRDVCEMSDAYVDAALRRARLRHCRVFLADDKMLKPRAAAIVRRYNASVFVAGAHNNPLTRAFRLHMDMLLLLRACYFVGNPASTLSGNVARVRALALGVGHAASNLVAGKGADEACLGISGRRC